VLKKIFIILAAALLSGIVFFVGCAGKESDTVAKSGDTVKVHYTGTLDDGSVFDSSENREPLEFTLGEGSVIPGFENAVMGLKLGDSVTVTIPAGEAYGEYQDNMLMEIDRAQLPQGLNPEVGMQLQMQQMDGTAVIVVISEVGEDSITIDGNHPLAGKDLTFEIELVEIN
jgi:peptidylprolyl isomerase